ncbi:MAG: cell division protein FtsZ, partial [Thermodesulfovibrionales bacterium]|nr:cell division protein FtsZ [Thermodesulfovibrionales bacterium]
MCIRDRLGILTVCIATKPFKYEGRRRAINAEEGINELKKYSDTFILIPNDRIRQIVPKDTPLIKAFEIADDVLRQSIQGISDIILVPGHINVDFADVKSVMTNSGRAVIGLGIASGENAAVEAARKAISNQLLEDSSIQEAKGILLNITGGLDFSIEAFEEASNLISNSAHEDANIIIGHVINPDFVDEVKVTVIATGIDSVPMPIQIKGAKPISISNFKQPKPSISTFNTSRIIKKSLDESKNDDRSILVPTFDEALSSNTPTTTIIETDKKDIPTTPLQPILPDEDIYDIPTILRKKQG